MKRIVSTDVGPMLSAHECFCYDWLRCQWHNFGAGNIVSTGIGRMLSTHKCFYYGVSGFQLHNTGAAHIVLLGEVKGYSRVFSLWLATCKC